MSFLLSSRRGPVGLLVSSLLLLSIVASLPAQRRDEHARSPGVRPDHTIFSSLDLPAPKYHHHGLIRDDSGKRLAKRDEAETLRSLREAGMTVEAVKERFKDAET